MSLGKKALLTVFIILLVDQLVKIFIKTHMVLGQEYKVFGDWFYIHFTENNGMAFGLELGGSWGKLLLSGFRLIAIGAIAWYLFSIVKSEASTGLVVSVSLILAGAIGNMIDCAFYGMIFSESYYQVAHAFPPDGGYSSFLLGRVVDMLYFPLIDTQLPKWLPIWGGQDFVFFRPVFNIADSCITIGVFIIIIFQRRFFKE
jgi:signal peptidase II